MQVVTRMLMKMLNYCSLLGCEIKKNWMGVACSTYREKRGAWLWLRGEETTWKT